MAKSKKSKSKGKDAGVLAIDWSKEEARAGGNFVGRVAEGDYPFEVKGVKKDESSKGNDMLVIDFVGTDGKVKGKETRDYFVLQPNQLGKLRELLEACGQKVPKKRSNIDTSKLVGSGVGITLGDEEYDGKTRSKPQAFVPLDDVKMPKKQDVEDDDDDDLAGLNRKQLEKRAKKAGLKAKKIDGVSDKKLRKAIEAAEEEDLSGVDLDDM